MTETEYIAEMKRLKEKNNALVNLLAHFVPLDIEDEIQEFIDKNKDS